MQPARYESRQGHLPDGLPGHRPDLPPAEDRGQDYGGLDPGEPFPEALAVAGTERDERRPGNRLGTLAQPAVWIERVRIRINARVAVYDIRGEEDRGAGWQDMAIQGHLADG